MALHALLVLSLVVGQAPPRSQDGFLIEVVDDQTGRGVPLVELETVNHVRFLTDSQGLAFVQEPGLVGQTVYFHVRSHGYQYPKDGFGYRGKAIELTKGGQARLRLPRINVAERLYRVTGEGIYRDSVLAGRSTPIRHPLLNAQVLGSDSVLNALYRGKIYWFWGDTNRPSYPLGNFQVTGATSRLPADGGLDPDVGIDLDYFARDDGFARPIAAMPGAGPTWLSGLVVLNDRSAGERMFATYAKIRASMETYERGLVEFNDSESRFLKSTTFPLKAPAFPHGHPFPRKVDGEEFIYFATPYPLVRVRANVESLTRPERYEAYTCLEDGSGLEKPRIDRESDGALRYRWRTGTPAVGPQDQAKLVKSGVLKEGEGLLQLRDFETGKPVVAHAGSVSWNAHRGRWVMIAVELFGTSVLGEVWYAEADTPLGPWCYARKVVTHERYSFYNPKQHPLFEKSGGRIIYFEGTYSETFSGNTSPTPRYDYNQMMYRLDLDDPRLNLPVAIYRVEGQAPLGTARGLGKESRLRPAFFALERPSSATRPVVLSGGREQGGLVLGAPADPSATVVFHALAADLESPPATTVPLYEYRDRDGRTRFYSTEKEIAQPGMERAERPFCRVWKNPLRVALPRD